jgi:hypothetical protein
LTWLTALPLLTATALLLLTTTLLLLLVIALLPATLGVPLLAAAWLLAPLFVIHWDLRRQRVATVAPSMLDSPVNSGNRFVRRFDQKLKAFLARDIKLVCAPTQTEAKQFTSIATASARAAGRETAQRSPPRVSIVV